MRSSLSARLFVAASQDGLSGKICRALVRVILGCDVTPGSRFLTPPMLPHPLGIVIGKGSSIGRNVTIYQGVTIGANRAGEYPVIGDDVVVYPNSTIIGGVAIGAGAVIGANALVVSNVPAGSVVRGFAARPGDS